MSNESSSSDVVANCNVFRNKRRVKKLDCVVCVDFAVLPFNGESTGIRKEESIIHFII